MCVFFFSQQASKDFEYVVAYQIMAVGQLPRRLSVQSMVIQNENMYKVLSREAVWKCNSGCLCRLWNTLCNSFRKANYVDAKLVCVGQKQMLQTGGASVCFFFFLGGGGPRTHKSQPVLPEASDLGALIGAPKQALCLGLSMVLKCFKPSPSWTFLPLPPAVCEIHFCC